MQASQKIQCDDRCKKYPIRSRSNAVISQWCSGCQQFIIPIFNGSIQCSCCGFTNLRLKHLSPMQTAEVIRIYQAYYSDRKLPKLLGILAQKGKTTTEIREELNGHYWSDVLKEARQLGLVKCERMKRYGRVKNMITVRGQLVLQLALVMEMKA